MEAAENESYSDDPFLLLERFIEWWIEIHQEEVYRLNILELFAQLDQDLSEARSCSEAARRHLNIINELNACLSNVEDSKCLILVEANTLYYLLNEIARSLTFESAITYHKITEGRLPCPWKFFGVNALKTLKHEVQSLVA